MFERPSGEDLNLALDVTGAWEQIWNAFDRVQQLRADRANPRGKPPRPLFDAYDVLIQDAEAEARQAEARFWDACSKFDPDFKRRPGG